ncbi:TetR/AcrR family transcriptional regulator [Zhongshania aquimaris]|uniref:TetR family transcriptional regulator n=1 Tax=Zhongshania aquimaris TaxID=2857107 RepID=A0ABS6VPX3_9GAMM|nr:TetR/AcrR family transcriptional regulator [Zhongshania aquimaris]MBW2940366.1 TetR family transcriptional regulator [Zhongshania aquimaris]
MSKSATDHVDEVPQRLVKSAIELYGTQGSNAVSAREIQRKAGVANEAAVRYYFKNKAGLLEACIAHLSTTYKPLIEEAWKELEIKKSKKALTVTDVMSALVISFGNLSIIDPPGVHLVARMIREQGSYGQRLLVSHFGDVIWRLEEALRDLLPWKSPEALRLHVFLAINSTVNGMVDQSILWRLPGTKSDEKTFKLEPDNLAKGFIAFISAGVSAPSDF